MRELNLWSLCNRWQNVFENSAEFVKPVSLYIKIDNTGPVRKYSLASGLIEMPTELLGIS